MTFYMITKASRHIKHLMYHKAGMPQGRKIGGGGREVRAGQQSGRTYPPRLSASNIPTALPWSSVPSSILFVCYKNVKNLHVGNQLRVFSQWFGKDVCFQTCLKNHPPRQATQGRGIEQWGGGGCVFRKVLKQQVFVKNCC